MPMFTSRRPNATFGCRRKSPLRRRKMRNRSSRVRKASQRRTSRPVSGTRLVAPRQSSTACNSSRWLVILRDIPAMNFRQRDKTPVLGNIVHAQRVQLQHPEITSIFDIDQTAAAATRQQLLPKLASEDVLIAVPHSSFFPPLGRLRKEGSGYSWAPVVFTDQWNEK